MDVVIPVQIVEAALWLCGGTVVLLLLLLVLVRARRMSGDRRTARRLAPLADDLLEVVCGEDPDGAASARLAAVPHRHRRTLERAIVARLEFVRGAPARELTDVLQSWGVRDRWVSRTRSLSPRRRAAAVSDLGFLGGDGVGDVLRARLGDRNDGVRSSAAHAIGRIRDVDGAALVLESVAPGPRGNVPLWVAMEGVCFPGASAGTMSALSHDSSVVRAAAARAVALGGWLGAAPAVRAAMADESDTHALVEQVRALAVVGSGADSTTLLDATRPAQAGAVRSAAVLALAELGGGVQPFMTLLSDPDDDVARAAVVALTRLGPTGRRALIDVEDPSPPVAQEVALAALSAAGRRLALQQGAT
ncbi:MAG: hypothetical protein ABIS84_14020 [Arachnia sp.]